MIMKYNRSNESKVVLVGKCIAALNDFTRKEESCTISDFYFHLKKPEKNLLYSTGNSIQYSVMNYKGIGSKQGWLCVYV